MKNIFFLFQVLPWYQFTWVSWPPLPQWVTADLCYCKLGYIELLFAFLFTFFFFCVCWAGSCPNHSFCCTEADAPKQDQLPSQGARGRPHHHCICGQYLWEGLRHACQTAAGGKFGANIFKTLLKLCGWHLAWKRYSQQSSVRKVQRLYLLRKSFSCWFASVFWIIIRF